MTQNTRKMTQNRDLEIWPFHKIQRLNFAMPKHSLFLVFLAMRDGAIASRAPWKTACMASFKIIVLRYFGPSGPPSLPKYNVASRFQISPGDINNLKFAKWNVAERYAVICGTKMPPYNFVVEVNDSNRVSTDCSVWVSSSPYLVLSLSLSLSVCVWNEKKWIEIWFSEALNHLTSQFVTDISHTWGNNFHSFSASFAPWLSVHFLC